MYKAVFKYLLFAISSCIACKSKSVPRRRYQPGAALGFSFSCWEAQTGWCAETRGLLWAQMWELWGCSAQGSWWALLLRSRLFGQNVRTPQEAIQPVRHLQGGQDCRCCVVKGMMFVYIYLPFPVSRGSMCSLLYSCPSGWCRGEGQVEELLPFSMEVILSVIKLYNFKYYYLCN